MYMKNPEENGDSCVRRLADRPMTVADVITPNM